MNRLLCSGSSAALHAGSGDQCQCADCHGSFPGGELRLYPHGKVCEGCHEAREASGQTDKDFGRVVTQPQFRALPVSGAKRDELPDADRTDRLIPGATMEARPPLLGLMVDICRTHAQIIVEEARHAKSLNQQK